MFLVGQRLRFAEWLQMEMDKHGWSQSDCARACDLNRAVINKLLNGRSKPQPFTLVAIARGFKIPVETVYRAAGLLPPSNDDETTLELIHIFNSIQSPQRKTTAIMLLKALIAEEENEQRRDGRGKQ